MGGWGADDGAAGWENAGDIAVEAMVISHVTALSPARVWPASTAVRKGTCRVCNQEGHPASQCPERPPDVCKNCKMEGHRTIDCKENRKFDLNNVPDKLPEEAWAAMQKASEEKDLEDFREVCFSSTFLIRFICYRNSQKKRL
ncbi:unnamed protein product [Aspergillus oryzae RIB40]|uniref:DNA, SC009 n=1 Tax=Aspergillus oryzae (strain ATCC 42149 / RIB 40) TaxID=510516 RepID=Q2UUL2_ASPOR|nr:unnamed protein product [Aspergillus oryzae RIB40]BAE54753.1 unnamed protein product [Aspergillus oryzae RIB40]